MSRLTLMRATALCRATSDIVQGLRRHLRQSCSKYQETSNLLTTFSFGSVTGQLCDGDPATGWYGITWDTGNYVTVAGQTAPFPGITLKNYGIVIDAGCHDILLQHIRVRPGDTSFYAAECDTAPRTELGYVDYAAAPGSPCIKSRIADPLTMVQGTGPAGSINGPPYNIVVDNSSFTWGGDQTIQQSADNVTYIDNIIGESLANPLHPKAEHSKGLVISGNASGVSGSRGVGVIRNLILHSHDRNPTIYNGWALLANNYMHDIGPLGSIGFIELKVEANQTLKAAISGNYIDQTSNFAIALAARDYPTLGAFPVFIDTNNYVQGVPLTDPWTSPKVLKCYRPGAAGDPVPPCQPWPAENIVDSSGTIWVDGFLPMGAVEARDYVRKNAGAWPAMRDW